MKEKSLSVFIEHILESIGNIESFMNDVSKQSFLENKEKQSAVIRQIEIIGEAVKNLQNSFKEKYPYILWQDIAGMRDKLMHHYFVVDSVTGHVKSYCSSKCRKNSEMKRKKKKWAKIPAETK